MKRGQSGAVIYRVQPDGLGAQMGLSPGDRILKVNGEPLKDLIDYSMLLAEEEIFLEVEGVDGHIRELSVLKEEDQGLGLEFEEAVFDGITPCANRCVFCFVDQMPPGQRSTLYVKDDDYRLSFLQGSYITLTNLKPRDWARIERLRLSPLYISVHATRPEVRRALLGQARAGQIIADLQRLGDHGIFCHTQAVLSPGINDGSVLQETLEDLFKLWPIVQTLAVVPVGLTASRAGLPALRRFTQNEARRVIEMVEKWQRRCLDKADTRWVWATDEFYLQAGLPLPSYKTYEGFEQLDNGVGLWRLLEREIEESAKAHKRRLKKANGSYGIITGRDAQEFWETIRLKLKPLAPGLHLDIYPVENRFFGAEVTVAGLVTGRDIIDMLQNIVIPAEQRLLVPKVMVRHGEDVFLDGITLAQLSAAADRRVTVVPVDGEAIVDIFCQAMNP